MIIHSRKPAKAHRKLTKADLAVFLRRLASIYDNSKTGNVALAEALYELADTLVQYSPHTPELPFSETTQMPGFHGLESLDSSSVASFISDESKTKRELIELAAARFSIPRSRLMRMKSSDVREAIKTALLHENSISIISEEARRSGADRKS
jgi:hypothetical protein